MAIHSCIFVWRIPWTEEPGGLHSPWGCQELDMTEVTMHAHTMFLALVHSPGEKGTELQGHTFLALPLGVMNCFLSLAFNMC